MEQTILVPAPRTISGMKGTYPVPATLESELAGYTVGAESPQCVRVRVDAGLIKGKQSYQLSISPDDLNLVAGDEQGLFYGFMTLRQLVRQIDNTDRIPCVHIEDWPEFPVRGVMFDISRDRAIELVPNQNSFGHMERWLKHNRYSHLSDATGSYVDPWGGLRHQATTLNPLDPESLHLLSGLYDELLPHFSSNMINVGADEPFDLGQGRSQEACQERGLGRVYLEFMLKIHGELSRRGKIMQFYGDIVLHHPELIKELPRDVIALNWGYEAEHPFNKETRMLAEAGLQFYVCPGTSSWNSIGGRWNNAKQNILSAAREGRSAGASGFLLTDWGDNGHWQQLPVSYPAYLFAATVSWNPEARQDTDVEALLSRHIFRDDTGKAAQALMILENLYDDGIVRFRNAGALGVLLLLELQPYHQEELKRLRGYDFAREQAGTAEVLSLLRQVDIRAEDADLLSEELTFTADLMAHAAHLGKERFATAGLTTAEIPYSARKTLADELEAVTEAFKILWLSRSRPGGLKDSAHRMLALKESYHQG